MAFAKGQLGKFTIIFYPKSSLPGVGVTYTPMYNPTDFQVSYKVSRDKKEVTGKGNLSSSFLGMEARTLNFELFFDGTGASPSSVGQAISDASINSSIQSVEGQIQIFRKLAYMIVPADHQPNYMMIIWGTFIMTATLDSADVHYTMFSPDGTPLRAKMKVTVTEYIDDSLFSKILSFQSPDLSKSITVTEGDTLPLLCFREYGDSSLYAKVARVNNLKNYRNLKQGMQLLFPPLTNLD
jgi:hypothetical protein